MDTARNISHLAAAPSLPRLEDLPHSEHGYDESAVAAALDAYRRHAAQISAQLRVLQAAVAPQDQSGHGSRMDALHLIQVATEFADSLERDALAAATAQLEKTRTETERVRQELTAERSEIGRYREESEHQRAALLNEAKRESDELRHQANKETRQEIVAAEAKARKLIEDARHKATDLVNDARAEVNETLDWAREHGRQIVFEGQQAAHKFLAAAGVPAGEATEQASEIAARVLPFTPEG
jgi:vacuolar-type H+-ATPase subunit H